MTTTADSTNSQALPDAVRTHTTVTHWGAYDVDSDGTEILGVRPFPKDPDPSPIGQSLRSVTKSRVMRPSIRKSWLEGGPGTRGDLRGVDPFVEVDWDTAFELVAKELDRVRTEHGNRAIFGGSYGWSSAGRFHHAQSQLHRFLNVIGGYTSKRDTYSHAAGEVITPHILGHNYWDLQQEHTSTSVIAEHSDLVVSFGGIPMKNAQVQNGGMGKHTLRGWLEQAKDRGCEFINISPIRDDVMADLDADWMPIRPGSDVAVICGLMHTLETEGLADHDFLDVYCHGWPELRSYLVGEHDGVAKSAEWAAEISEIPAEAIRTLARSMAAGRTMLNIAWGVQRADYGEHTWWATVALAAVLGQIGLPGGGFGFGYGAVGSIGNGVTRMPFPALPQGENPVEDYIPVARIADLLERGGESYTYNGEDRVYPHIEVVYWAGGNPYHHHQDLNRLNRAWAQPATVIVHEPFWTATAKRADIVLPSTTPLERYDIGGSPREDFLFAMEPVIERVGESRDDYEIFTGIAACMGLEEAFTEGRTPQQWIRHFWDEFQTRFPEYPTYDEFVELGNVQHAHVPESTKNLLEAFRRDPVGNALPTPSGKIELYSEAIAGFDIDDCPPLPAFSEPKEWLGNAGTYPLHMISNQPPGRLHSQLDHGETSTNRKIAGRERMRIHPDDAGPRGLATGGTARVFNARGSCFVGVEVTESVRSGVIELPTGAWYDPVDPAIPGSPCRHGNPNVLTRDEGTTGLGQGPVAQSCLVDVEPAPGAPAPDPFSGPAFVKA